MSRCAAGEKMVWLLASSASGGKFLGDATIRVAEVTARRWIPRPPPAVGREQEKKCGGRSVAAAERQGIHHSETLSQGYFLIAKSCNYCRSLSEEFTD